MQSKFSETSSPSSNKELASGGKGQRVGASSVDYSQSSFFYQQVERLLAQNTNSNTFCRCFKSRQYFSWSLLGAICISVNVFHLCCSHMDRSPADACSDVIRQTRNWEFVVMQNLYIEIICPIYCLINMCKTDLTSKPWTQKCCSLDFRGKKYCSCTFQWLWRYYHHPSPLPCFTWLEIKPNNAA